MIFLLTEKLFIKDVLYPEEPLATRQLLGGPDQRVDRLQKAAVEMGKVCSDSRGGLISLKGPNLTPLAPIACGVHNPV